MVELESILESRGLIRAKHISTILQCVIFILIVNHVLACVTVYVGRREQQSHRTNWMDENQVTDNSWLFQYMQLGGQLGFNIGSHWFTNFRDFHWIFRTFNRFQQMTTQHVFICSHFSMCCKDCFCNSFLKKLLRISFNWVIAESLRSIRFAVAKCFGHIGHSWPFMAIHGHSWPFYHFPYISIYFHPIFISLTAVTASHCQVHSSTIPFCCNQRAGTSPGAGDHPDVFAHAGSTDWKLGCPGLGALPPLPLSCSRVCNESHWLFRLPFRGIISGTLNKMNEKTKDALSRYAELSRVVTVVITCDETRVCFCRNASP